MFACAQQVGSCVALYVVLCAWVRFADTCLCILALCRLPTSCYSVQLENLLLDREGRLKIADFGLSFVKATASSADDLLHTVVGSDDFLSPEVVRRLPYHGDKIDAWSSGIVLYVLLAGFLPFRAVGNRSLAEAITGGMLSFPDHFSGDAIDVIRRLLANDPERRPAVGVLRRHRWFADVPGTEAYAIATSSVPAARHLSMSALSHVDDDGSAGSPHPPMPVAESVTATPTVSQLAVPPSLSRRETFGPPPELPSLPSVVMRPSSEVAAPRQRQPELNIMDAGDRTQRHHEDPLQLAVPDRAGPQRAAARSGVPRTPPSASGVGDRGTSPRAVAASTGALPPSSPRRAARATRPTSDTSVFDAAVLDRALPDVAPAAPSLAIPAPVRSSNSLPGHRSTGSESPTSKSGDEAGRDFGVSSSAGHLPSAPHPVEADPPVVAPGPPRRPMGLDDGALLSSVRNVRLGSDSGVFDEGADESEGDSELEEESPVSSNSDVSTDALLHKISVSTNSSSNAGAVWRRFKRPPQRDSAAPGSSGAPRSYGAEGSSARGGSKAGFFPSDSRRTTVSSDERESHRSFMSLAIRNIADFARTYEAMRDKRLGVPVADRRYRLKTYPRTFVGSEAVSWMVKNLRLSHSAAMELGQDMVNAGVFHHVCHAHNFKDEYLFYRWEEDEQRDLRVLNAAVAWAGAPCAEPVHLSVALLTQLATVMRKHQPLPIDSEHTRQRAGEVDLDTLEMSEEWRAYLRASSELQSVSLSSLRGRNERLAFFVNVYNVLALHAAVSRRGVPVAARARRQFFRRIFFDIGSTTWSLDDIHHGVLRANAASPVRVGWRAQFPASDRRYRLALPYSEPLTHFVLSLGVRDMSPPIRTLTAASVAEGSVLTTAAATFLTSTVSVSVAQRRVTLPRVFLQYPSDFDRPEAALLSWVAKMMTPPPGSTPPPSGLPALPESPEASKQTLLAAQIRSLLRGSGLTPQVTYQAQEGGDKETMALAPVFIL